MSRTAQYVGVVGPGSDVTEEVLAEAAEVGRLLAIAGCIVVTGGLGGVMEATSRGASVAGGVTVGILPGAVRDEGNEHLTIALPTGMGEMRNALLVRTCDAIICVGGSWGTLSEVALAVRTGVPVVMVRGWDLPEGPLPAPDASAAVELALTLLDQR
ncbi:TIGR00725 family protein [Ornithinimicrobium cavernae]|uniref:TIGR00725 family protein n=1 Tax=Ornithinimicrobium cavernae TaxID=2666047 RepID=UPI000D69F79A|nr:TIGR00725 family protein [Ornithinimicrobium cavernae]